MTGSRRRGVLGLTVLGVVCFAAGPVHVLASSQSGWSALAPLPTGTAQLAVAASAGKIYAIGGNTASGGPGGQSGFVATTEVYDPSTNSWSAAASMATARADLSVAVGSDGTIFAIGGETNTTVPTADVEAFDPSTNTWTTEASLPTATRDLAAAAGPDGKIYAFGGNTNDTATVEETGNPPTTAAEVYDPSANTWSSIASLPTARDHLMAVTGPDGRIYVIGGTGAAPPAPSGGSAPPLTTVEAYDPASNAWSTVAPIPQATWAAGAALGPDGQIYIIGGWNQSTASDSQQIVYSYNATANAWSTAADMPTGREFLGAAENDGTIAAVGGSQNQSGPCTAVPSCSMGTSTLEATTEAFTPGPATNVPESPLSIGLPVLGGFVLLGGFALAARRRTLIEQGP